MTTYADMNTEIKERQNWVTFRTLILDYCGSSRMADPECDHWFACYLGYSDFSGDDEVTLNWWCERVTEEDREEHREDFENWLDAPLDKDGLLLWEMGAGDFYYGFVKDHGEYIIGSIEFLKNKILELNPVTN